MSLKITLKHLVPFSIWDPIAKRYRWAKQDLSWAFDPQGIRSRRCIRSYKNRFRGKRCFIIGNGPSLNNMDLSPLREEYTFGLNRIYLLFPKIGFNTTFLVSVNRLVIDQFSHELAQMDIPVFLGWRARNLYDPSQNDIYINNRTNLLNFSRVADWYVYEVGTVTYVAMQLAFYMGFEKVILIGLDHTFSVEGKPNQQVVSTKADRNHFDPNYFGKGIRWNLPDLNLSEKAYRLAKHAFEEDHRSIVDATVDGHLQVFPKTSYASLFQV
jgi:hypothetical protein